MFIPRQDHELGKTILSGQVTTTGSATALSADRSCKNGVIVQALSTNTASIYVGDSSVTSASGFELQAGQSTSIGTDNLARVYFIGTSGDKICYITTA